MIEIVKKTLSAVSSVMSDENSKRWLERAKDNAKKHECSPEKIIFSDFSNATSALYDKIIAIDTGACADPDEWAVDASVAVNNLMLLLALVEERKGR